MVDLSIWRPLGVKAGKGGPISQNDVTRGWQPDQPSSSEVRHRTRYSLDGKAEVIGNVLARHRQLKLVCRLTASSYLQQERADALFGTSNQL